MPPAKKRLGKPARRRAIRTSRASHAIRASLEQSDTFYKSLVETLPQNFFRKDLNGRLTYANTLYCQTIGRPWEDLKDKRNEDYFPPDIAAKYTADDEHVIGTGEKLEMVEVHPQSDGRHSCHLGERAICCVRPPAMRRQKICRHGGIDRPQERSHILG